MALRALATCAVGLGLVLGGCASSDPAPVDDAGARAPATPSTETSSQTSQTEDTRAAPANGGGGDVHERRGAYADLPDMGETREYFRAHGSRTLVDRGYFRGDLVLAGAGLRKEGAGHDESVIDGHLEIRGDGWTLTGLTVTGDVTIRGENNDLSGCRVLGRIDARGAGNTLPPR